MLPERLGLRVGDRVIEGVECAVVMAEALAHQGQHVLGDGVGGKACQQRRLDLLGQRLAVLGVEVPGAALGCAIAMH